MGVRNILILFFATMAVSLIVLTAIFYLLFDKVDLSFETKLPESAPTVEYNAPPEEDTEIDDEKKSADAQSAETTDDTPNTTSSDDAASTAEAKKKTSDLEASPPGTSADAAVTGKGRQEKLGRPRAFKPGKPGFRASGLTHAVVRVPGSDNTVAVAKPSENPAHPAELVASNEPSSATLSEDPPPMHLGKTFPKPPLTHTASSKPPTPAVFSPPSPGGVLPQSTGPPRPPVAAKASDPLPALFQVYIDGFDSEEAAQSRLDSIRSSGTEAFLSRASGKPIIKLGTFSNRATAQGLASQHGAKIKEVN